MTRGNHCLAVGMKACVSLLLLGTLLAFGACSDQASYPSKPVKLIVPFGPGGPSDLNARLIAEHSKSEFPKGIVITNEPGGSATIGTYQAISAEPDGYTWIYGGTAELASALHTIKVPYTLDDYTLVLKVGNMPTVLLVRKDKRWSNLNDFVAYAKQNPGAVKVGTPGDASVNRLVGEMFAEAAGIQLVMVPFRGNAAAVTAVLGEHVQAALVNAPDAKAHAKDDSNISALAIFSGRRVPGVPQIPTAQEQGFDVTGTVSHYIAVSKKTPAATVEIIRTKLLKLFTNPAYLKAEDAIAFQVEYKDGTAARNELKDWYDTAGKFYKKLGMLTQ